LGPHGLNLQDFCSRFNAATAEKGDNVIPVEITIFEDRTFDLKLKTPPAADLLKKAAKVEKGAKDPLKGKVGSVTRDQIRQIAETKMPDLNADTIEQAMKIVEGTARSMGIEVK